MHWFESIDSTSNEARRQISTERQSSSSASNYPLLFVADEQTQGRGRGGHSWWSPKGCLMLTLVLGNECMPSDIGRWSQLALVVGLAVARAVEHFATDSHVQLKWPNDVFLEGKKCSGILIESGPISPGALPQTWMVGIGLNVDMAWREAPEGISNRATCINSHTAHSVTIPQALPKLIESIESSVREWANGDDDWLADWQSRCFLRDREVEISLPAGQVVLGVCRSIDSYGQLIIDTAKERVTLLSGEVVHWSEPS